MNTKQSSEKTNFQKIREFHNAFGLDNHNTHQLNVFDNEKLIKLRLALISEEFQELQDAIKERDFTEVRDAISDILYVVYGTAASFGIDADADYKIIHNSNMTKLCKTEEEAKETVKSYEKQYQDGKSPYDSPAYKKAADDVHYIVYNESTGKVLKSINYTPADLTNVNNFKDKF